MTDKHLHTAHPDVVKRLKRAHGHLQNVIAMIEAERACVDVAQQLHAVERAISAAKKLVIHDHLDHCLEEVVGASPAAIRSSVAEFKDITKYL
ncbi:metal-sensing transcriptional repressor [Cupriavidus metallidurans]|uniref:metal-sensing transcriptional repressor n=1 Tax=Cupriavidus metallidurans TaxID=119219 RepID=UPI000492FB45|nr:metal-sensing transcriptional repressor [Cupriavidus metallidurans]